MDNNTLKLLEEFNRYFTSGNDVDVPARINVSRDEWRQLYKNLKERNTQQVPMTPDEISDAYDEFKAHSLLSFMKGVRAAEVHHLGITAQCVNTTEKGGAT